MNSGVTSSSTADNPRLFPRIRRDCKEWRKRYAMRTGLKDPLSIELIFVWKAVYQDERYPSSFRIFAYLATVRGVTFTNAGSFRIQSAIFMNLDPSRHI